MNRPIESDYVSHVAYTRALEEYCDKVEPTSADYAKGFAEGFNEGCRPRPWVGLTDDDWAEIESDEFWRVGIARAVEAKLKEKNA
jgi:hypothetical protein